MKVISAARRRWRWAVGLVVVTALGLGYAGQVASADQTSNRAPVFSAVDLADAVLYYEGPAAKLLPGLERPAIEWTDDARMAREAINKAIETDERWSASFQARMQSGDPVRISAAIKDLAVFSRNVMNEQLGKDVVDRALDAGGQGSLGRALVWHTWVFVYKYIAFIRYLWVVWAFEVKDPAANPALPDELTVRAIAENLSTQG